VALVLAVTDCGGWARAETTPSNITGPRPGATCAEIFEWVNAHADVIAGVEQKSGVPKGELVRNDHDIYWQGGKSFIDWANCH
jgi:hypothetical protein